jgi:hypothetical protein
MLKHGELDAFPQGAEDNWIGEIVTAPVFAPGAENVVDGAFPGVTANAEAEMSKNRRLKYFINNPYCSKH